MTAFFFIFHEVVPKDHLVSSVIDIIEHGWSADAQYSVFIWAKSIFRVLYMKTAGPYNESSIHIAFVSEICVRVNESWHNPDQFAKNLENVFCVLGVTPNIQGVKVFSIYILEVIHSLVCNRILLNYVGIVYSPFIYPEKWNIRTILLFSKASFFIVIQGILHLDSIISTIWEIIYNSTCG